MAINAPFGEIIAPNVDTGPINNGIYQRAIALSEQLNPDAAAEFLSEMSAFQCTVKGEGKSIHFSLEANGGYLLGVLHNPPVPLAGGDGGTAHNADGSTYQSAVDPKFYGNPLESLQLPRIEGEQEANHIVELFAGDAANDAASKSDDAISNAIEPQLQEMVAQQFGGV